MLLLTGIPLSLHPGRRARRWPRRINCEADSSRVSLRFRGTATNGEPTRQIRFNSAEEAVARREKLIRFMWADGLPDSRPTVNENINDATLQQHLKGVDRSLVRRIDRLELKVLGLGSLAYLIHPAKSSDAARLAIVHAGHSQLGDFIERDYHDSIHLFLRRGFSVAMMTMP